MCMSSNFFHYGTHDIVPCTGQTYDNDRLCNIPSIETSIIYVCYRGGNGRAGAGRLYGAGCTSTPSLKTNNITQETGLTDEGDRYYIITTITSSITHSCLPGKVTRVLWLLKAILNPSLTLAHSTTGDCHLYIAREMVYSSAWVAVAFKRNSSYFQRANDV